MSSDGGNSWFEIGSFHNRNAKGQAELNAFLEHQIRLLDCLAGHRNTYVNDLIVKKERLTWQQCFTCVKDNSLPTTLREAFVRAIKTLFIDVDPNVDVFSTVQLNHVWSHLSEKMVTALDVEDDALAKVSVTGSRFDHFPELTKWIDATIHDFFTQYLIDSAGNCFLSSVLELVDLLIRYGYYTDSERVTKLVIGIVSILDGRTDKASNAEGDGKALLREIRSVDDDPDETKTIIHDQDWLNTHRFKKSFDNNILVEAKCRALDVLTTIVKLAMNARLQRTMYTYKVCSEVEKDKGIAVLAKMAKGVDCIRALGEARQETARTTSMNKTAEDFLAYVSFQSSWFSSEDLPDDIEPPSEELVNVLLDLTQYDFPQLYLRSIHLIRMVFSVNQDLCDAACKAVMLKEETSVELAKQLQRDLPVLKRIGAGNATADAGNSDKVIRILNDLTKKSVLYDDRPHKINQRIIFNSGIVYVLMDLLKIEGQRIKLLNAIFTFLAAICASFKPGQELLARHIDLFLSCEALKDQDGWQDAMSKTLIAVFEENEATCRDVSPKSIEQIVLLVCKLTTVAPGLLKVLCVLTRLETNNVIFSQNQLQIMKLLVRERAKCIDEAFVSNIARQDEKEKKKKPNRVANFRRGRKPAKPLPTLAYHMGVLRILACCADGSDAFIKSACTTILPLSKIVEVLADSTVHFYFKTYYFKFIVVVYLRTARRTPLATTMGSVLLQSETSVRQTEETVKMGCERLASILAAHNLAPAMKGKIRTLAQHAKGAEKDAESNDQTGRAHERNFERGVLTKTQHEYCFIGFLPFLAEVVNAFTDESKRKPSVGADMIASFEKDDTFKGVLAFISEVLPTLTKKTDMIVTADVLNAIRKFRVSLRPECSRMLKGIKKMDQKRTMCMGSVVYQAQYSDKYAEQEQLNVRFDNCTLRLLEAYQGENTIEKQLPESKSAKHRGQNFDPSTQLKLAYCEPEGSDEYLPLGKEFHNFVHLFVKSDGNRGLNINVQAVRGIIKVWEAVTKHGPEFSAEMRASLVDTMIRTLQTLR